MSMNLSNESYPGLIDRYAWSDGDEQQPPQWAPHTEPVDVGSVCCIRDCTVCPDDRKTHFHPASHTLHDERCSVASCEMDPMLHSHDAGQVPKRPFVHPVTFDDLNEQLGLIRSLRPRWLYPLNFLVLQWFGVRLQRSLCYRDSAWHHDRWSLRRWVLPLTGWWSRYVETRGAR